MLTQMREATKGFLAWLLVIPLIGAFAAWGIQDFVSVGVDTSIAKIGDTAIEPQQFQRELRDVLKRIEARGGQVMSEREARKRGIHRETLAAMIDRIALSQKGQKMGLVASQKVIMDILKTVPGMTDPNGNIVPERMAELLRQNDMTEPMLIRTMTEDIVRENMINSLVTGLAPPSGLTAALNTHRLEQRVAEYLLIAPARAGAVADPDTATLAKYYEANAVLFREPERRAVTIMAISPKAIAAQVTIGEDEIAKLYEARRAVYVVPEKRSVEQIRFKDEAAARAGAARLERGDAFEAVALANGMKAADIRIGEIRGDDKNLPPDLFTNALQKPTAPFKGAFGWVIQRATKSTPGETKTLDTVREELKTALAEQRAKDMVTELSNKLEDALAAQLELEEAAKKAGLPAPQAIAAIDVSGKGAQGETIDGLPNDPEFLTNLFASDVGRVSGLKRDADNGYYVIRTDKVMPSSLPKLETIKDKVLKVWREEAETLKIKAFAETLAERGNKGAAIKVLGDELGIAPLSTPGLGRMFESEVFSRAFVAAAFAAKTGQFFTAPVRVGKSYLVARLASVSTGQDQAGSTAPVEFGNSVRQSLATDIADVFTGSVKAEFGITDEKIREYGEKVDKLMDRN